MNTNIQTIVIAGVVGLVIILGAGWYLLQSNTSIVELPTEVEVLPVEPDGGIGDGADPLPEANSEPVTQARGPETVIGQSVNGAALVAYHFGSGAREILLVGGVHGGYSPGTTRLANEFVTYFKQNPSVIPANVTVTIIPELNPDGAKMTGATGRFNANTVDLNRNFDCEWSTEGIWQDRTVSGGSAPFSEPEAQALRAYVTTNEPTAAIVWFSAEGKVYPSACAGAPSNASANLAAAFATAAAYPTEAEFNAYAITGDMVNWMAKEGIPAISVLLTDHQSSEWNKNKAGIDAVLRTYAN